MKELSISSIQIHERARKDIGDIADLKESIQSVGLLHPVVVNSRNELVSGRRRIEAFRALGRKTVPATIVNHLDEAILLLIAERDENVCRKDFTPSEAVALGVRLEELERPKAQAKQKAQGEHGKEGGRGKKKNPVSKLDKGKPSRTDVAVANAVGMKKDTYRKAKVVVESGDDLLVHEMDKSGNVDKAFKKLNEKKKHELAEQIRKEPFTPPTGRHRVIVIDPPWKYGNRVDDTTHRGRKRGAA